MAAFRIVGWERAPELVDVAIPAAGPGQVRVRVAGCGLCHSDLAMTEMPAAVGEALGWQLPFTLGHETVGWIDAIGPGADVGGLREGDAVAVASTASCGRCRWCRRGQENACPESLVGRGYGRDGGLASHVLVGDVRALLPLGDLDPVMAGPLTDAGATSFHAVRRLRSRLEEGSTAVVVGAGGLGAFVVQILRATTPARVVAIDPNPLRREVVQDLGAHEVVDGVDEATADAVRALAGDTVDAVVDLVGSDDTIATAVSVLAPGGALAVVGAAGGKLRRPVYGGLPRDGELFTFQGSDLSDLAAVVALAQEGRVRVEIEPYRLDDVAEAYAALAGGTLRGRAVVSP